MREMLKRRKLKTRPAVIAKARDLGLHRANGLRGAAAMARCAGTRHSPQIRGSPINNARPLPIMAGAISPTIEVRTLAPSIQSNALEKLSFFWKRAKAADFTSTT